MNNILICCLGNGLYALFCHLSRSRATTVALYHTSEHCSWILTHESSLLKCFICSVSVLRGLQADTLFRHLSRSRATTVALYHTSEHCSWILTHESSLLKCFICSVSVLRGLQADTLAYALLKRPALVLNNGSFGVPRFHWCTHKPDMAQSIFCRLYHTSNSRKCMGVNGEALQLYAVYKKPYFLLQVT